jgi:hypothetical protein
LRIRITLFCLISAFGVSSSATTPIGRAIWSCDQGQTEAFIYQRQVFSNTVYKLGLFLNDGTRALPVLVDSIKIKDGSFENHPAILFSGEKTQLMIIKDAVGAIKPGVLQFAIKGQPQKISVQCRQVNLH